MRRWNGKFAAALLGSALLVSMLAGCGDKNAYVEQLPESTESVSAEETEAEESEETESETESESVSEEAEETEALELDTETPIRMAVLTGATGYSAAKLMSDADGNLTTLNYSITAESSPKVIMDSLVSGDLDVAALPTNKAAMIYQATEGKIQMAAVNTLGVMYLVSTNGETVSDLSLLSGKTVSIPEEPSYILTALLQANGITDVNVVTVATPSDLPPQLMTGEVEYAVLPEPLVSTVCAKKDTIQVQLSLTEEWEKVYTDCDLMQGCIVVTREWADAHPAELDCMLSELEGSMVYMKEASDEAAAMVETYFGTPAAVAKKTIENCNMTFICGEEMKTRMTKFYEILSEIPESNIGAVPDETFYIENAQ